MPGKLFKTEGDTLTLYRDPELIEIEKVKAAMYEIFGQTPDRTVTLDLSPMPGISSTTVGMVVALHLRASEADRKLRIRLNPRLLKLFELTMLTDTLSLEMIGKDEDEEAGKSGGKPKGKAK
jgi:anti-anti-sigma regulatory factor